jgi:hypothetical protein
MTHVSYNLDVIVRCRLIDKSSTTVEIVSSQAIYDGLDWLECAFVQNEVPGHDMYCSYLSICYCNQRVRHTIANSLHVRLEEDDTFKFEDLPVIFINDFQRLVDNYSARSD